MLFKLIKEKINLYDKDDLSKKLGYSNQVKFEETLNEFLQFKNLYQWFEKGYYDLNIEGWSLVDQPSSFLKRP
jgi:hypothetical protein